VGSGEEPWVATVAGLPIPVSRLDERVAALRRGPRGRHLPPEGGPESLRARRWVVQDLVTEAVVAHEARALGVSSGPTEPGPPEVQALADLVTRGVVVAESELHAYYERNADLFGRPETRRIRQVVAPDAAGAREAALDISGGEELALRRGEFAGPLEEAVFTATVGELLRPIQSEHGWHVALLEAIEPEGMVPFAEARSAIEAELLAAARIRAFGEWLEGRRQALVVIDPAYEHPAHPVHGLASHRH
jgi:[acyl-carrier-protein] S-malonyltransferase